MPCDLVVKPTFTHDGTWGGGEEELRHANFVTLYFGSSLLPLCTQIFRLQRGGGA